MHQFKKLHASTVWLALSLSALIFTTTNVFADQTPTYNIGGAIKEATPPPTETKKTTPPPEIPLVIQEEKPLSLPDGETLFIKDFKLEGAGDTHATELSELLSPYKNRDLTMAEITEVANKLTLFYRKQGYLCAKAYVPVQDARDGILLIKILMGEYGTFSLENSSLVRDSLVQSVFDSTKKACPTVTQDGLARALLLVGDMPGSNLPKVAIAPGAIPGTSNFVVSAEAAQRFNGYLMADNQGSRYTGKKRLYGGIDINSPLGIADKLSVSGMTSEGTDLWNLRLAYSFPLSNNGLRAEIAASHTDYQLGGVFSDLDAVGTANIIEATISYPIKRGIQENYNFFINMAYKDLKDDLRAVNSRNPREAFVGTLTLQREAYGRLFGHNFFTSMSGGFSFGSVEILNKAQRELNDAGADTEGFYSRANLDLSANLALTNNLSARASFKLQQVLSGNNLDSSEQFFISGISGVRAYFESVGFDNGTLVNAELRYALPTLFGIKHSVAVFVDNGWVYAEKGNYTTNDSFTLSDAGASYNISYRQLFCSVQLAKPIGKASGVNDPGTQFLLQFGASF